jgi:methylase of polypeptide subunit release factors
VNASQRTQVTALGEPVWIEPAQGVFVPTPNGLFYARSIRVSPGERVIDVGTGSGVLGIAAARAGAQVSATDTDARAVRAARHNAALNDVKVDASEGPFFADFDGEFDVILANLPNEIVAPSHLARLAPAEARTFAGGAQGNALLLELLRRAPRYMHAQSRLYLGVHSLTDYHGTLRTALERFEMRLIDVATLPAKPFVGEHIGEYLPLRDAGVISLFKDAEGWHTFGYVYELRLASR